MSAKTNLIFLLVAILLASFSTTIAQNDIAGSEDAEADSNSPQFLIRAERNGKTKYEECALPNLYFHKATSATQTSNATTDGQTTTAKGAADSSLEYYGYVFFLVKADTIVACNESGEFKDQSAGMYTLSGFSYPLSVSPESFKGKNINTVANHPSFEADPAFKNVIIRLLPEKKSNNDLSTEPATSPDPNTLGQIRIAVPTSN